MNRISSFAPIVTKESKILILGSVPGMQSLEKQQYYGHPQNKFWQIMFALFNEEFSTDYEARISLLNINLIALWDTIESCERKGSLDSDIKNEEVNKISELLETHSNISAIFCNGQKSYKNLEKIFNKNFPMLVFAMPSTSPAYAGMPFEKKLEAWSVILHHLK